MLFPNENGDPYRPHTIAKLADLLGEHPLGIPAHKVARLVHFLIRYGYDGTDNDQAAASKAEDQGVVQRGWGGRARLSQAVAYSLCREDLYQVYPAVTTDGDSDVILDSG